MRDPAIVSYGRNFVNHYSVEEYRESFVRAFKDNRADFIVLDSNPRGNKFLATAAAWAIDEKLLYNDRTVDDIQETICLFRLTKKGRKEILNQL